MPRHLYRSRHDRMLFGVAGGMARYFDIDAAVVRIIWALLVLAGGAGFLLYVVAAIVIPEEPSGAAAPPPGGAAGATAGATAGAAASSAGAGDRPWGYRAGIDRRDRGGGAVILGIVLIVLGAWFLLRRFIPAIDPDVVWPVVLLVLGGALVLGALRRR